MKKNMKSIIALLLAVAMAFPTSSVSSMMNVGTVFAEEAVEDGTEEYSENVADEIIDELNDEPIDTPPQEDEVIEEQEASYDEEEVILQDEPFDGEDSGQVVNEEFVPNNDDDYLSLEDVFEEEETESIIVPSDMILTEKSSERDGFSKMNIRADAGSENAELRIYFWLNNKDLPSDINAWNDYLTDPFEEISIDGLDDFLGMDLPITLQDGSSSLVGAQLIYEDKDSSGSIDSVFLDMTMPAQSSMDTDIYIASPSDVNIMVQASAMDQGLKTVLNYLSMSLKAKEDEADADSSVPEEESESEGTDAIEEESEEDETDVIVDQIQESVSSLSLSMNGALVNLKASNAKDEASPVRLYFWNFDEEENITGPADISAGEEMNIPAIDIIYNDGTEDQVYGWYAFDGESAYISFDLPAHSFVDANMAFDIGYDVMLEAVMDDLSDRLILKTEAEESNAPSEEESQDPEFDQAVSTTGIDIMPMSIVSDSQLWWFDDYYVSSSDLYNVHETDDFSLKYQLEFHTSEDMTANSVIISIPASLGTYRSGSGIYPADIGVPYGTPDNYTATKSTPFNYYYTDEYGNIVSDPTSCEGEVNLVFWNYEDIASGTNVMIQVLYQNINIMQVPDGTKWSSTPVVTVVHNGETETKEGYTLSGDVNTQATLSSVTKSAYTASGVSYTPELYTQSQVSSYITGSIPSQYAGSNFDDYIYLVWKVNVTGSATQKWSLQISDATSVGNLEGSVVGYSISNNGDGTASTSGSTSRTISQSFYVVTAYDKEEFEAITGGDYDSALVQNTVTVTLHPEDGIDANTSKKASATATWNQYIWEYDGDGAGVGKWAYDAGGTTKQSVGSYSPYKEIYSINSDKNQETSDFHYFSESLCYGYAMTHIVPIENDDGTITMPEDVGEYIDGSYYQTVTYDDIMYFYPNGSSLYGQALTKDDYYFDSVKVTVKDTGYDVWEDKTATCETIDDVDQNAYVYAMFYDSTDWEYVGEMAWNNGGSMSYTLASDAIARQPYRIKVVHNGVGYETVCDIDVYVTLRPNAPTITDAVNTYEADNGEDSISYYTIENLNGMSCEQFVNAKSAGYVQPQSASGGAYSDYDSKTGTTLADFTRSMYGTILMRDQAYVKLTGLETYASANKSMSLENDTVDERVLANYYLTAYEGYYANSQSIVNQLEDAGLALPKRNDVVWYDLLPFGMEFNASAGVTAGRLSTISGSSWKTNARAWDTSGVSVQVESDDIIPDWNGTGRTMVKFHIHYDGDDASSWSKHESNSNEGLWFEGFGIYFQAYYDWDMINEVDGQYNIAAYIVEDSTDDLLGTHGSQVYKDDGSYDGSSSYDPFKIYDLNEDGVTDKYTNMYAQSITNTSVATSSTSSVDKKVRADADIVADYSETAAVGYGNGYTYQIAVTNFGSGILSDIVIFDNLEYAVEEGRTDEAEKGTGVYKGLSDDEINNHWTGTFTGLSIDALTDLGIDVAVYYNADRNATISTTDQNTPSDVLTESNGWYSAQKWEESGYSLADVKAIAVDISHYADGSNVTLESGESLAFDLHMTAPVDTENPMYAFNDTSFYAVNTAVTGDKTSSTTTSDAVRVELGDVGKVEVSKYMDGTIPNQMSNAKFTFAVTRKNSVLANQEYLLYDLIDGEWVDSGVIGATDINGQFTLKANEKAVFFNLADYEDVDVNEVDSVFWDSNGTSSSGDDLISFEFINAYRSPVYLYKTALTTDLASEEELENTKFTFKLSIDADGDGEFEPYANGLVAYVSEALTDGSSPEIYGYDYTDADGCIAIGIDDIIAFFPMDQDGNAMNVDYRIDEIDIGDDWIAQEESTSGTTSVYGQSSTITNYYKYRTLTLTKTLANYTHDIDDCNDAWTFRVTDADGNVVSNLHWYMIDEDGNPVLNDSKDPIEGYLDGNGEFTFSGAGSNHQIVIEGLIAGEEYTVSEVSYDESRWDYMGDGVYTMPDYSVNKSGAITNKFLLKNLSVSKLVLSKDAGSDSSNNTDFTFTLEKLVDGNYRTEAGLIYTVDGIEYQTDENGQFTLKNNQTADFEDLGYEHDQYRISETTNDDYWQVYPAEGEPYISELGVTGDSVQFVNGDFEDIVSITKTLQGMDDVGMAFTNLVKADNTTKSLESQAYTVDVTFGIYDGDDIVTSDEGNLVDFDENSDYPYVYIKVTKDGVTLNSYNGGLYTDTLAPFDYIYIAEIGDYTVKASEDASMEKAILDVSKLYTQEVGSSEILSEGSVMNGEGVANDSIALINNISSANNESEIFKLMSEGSTDVPTGAKMFFRVESYHEDSDSWTPAKGIRYIIFDDDGPVTGIETTASDGKIAVTKTDNGYPVIRFVDDEVYANIYTDAENGQLRIRELIDESDADWGWLVGYDGEGWMEGPSLDIAYADTFVNGNDEDLQFEVEKKMEDTSSDATFTFQLKEIIGVSTLPVTTTDDIVDDVEGSNIHYTVYDKETGERISDGYTDSKGQFTLKANQYAVLDVPEGTNWIVNELITTGFELTDAKANHDAVPQAVIVDDVNGVYQVESTSYLTHTIILTLTTGDDGSAISGATFNLYKDGQVYKSNLKTNSYGQITVDELESGVYYFLQTATSEGYTMPSNKESESVEIKDSLLRSETYYINMENSDSYTVKYAVTIYGINHDVDESGNALGLTFGPATGADYVNSYSAHLTEEEYDSGECGVCLHWMTWSEIIEQSEKDPYAFQDCLINGCTHSVKLEINKTIMQSNYSGKMDNGDGCGIMARSINQGYMYWNTGTTGVNSKSTNSGGWRASQIRSVLDGKDEYTGNSTYASHALDASEAIISCFPEILQESIVPKAVKSDIVYNSRTEENNVTTYDKLWLLSSTEMWGDDGTNNSYLRPLEGSLYERQELLGITTSNYDAVVPYTEEETSTSNWWIRSIGTKDSEAVLSVDSNGALISRSAWSAGGLAPCFCLR